MSGTRTVEAPTQPAPGESLAAWAKRCHEYERWESRSARANQLLQLIQRVLTWPPDRVTVVYAPRTYEVFGWVDSVNFRLIADEDGDHLLAAGLDSWHEVTSAAQLSDLLRAGKLRGFGA